MNSPIFVCKRYFLHVLAQRPNTFTVLLQLLYAVQTLFTKKNKNWCILTTNKEWNKEYRLSTSYTKKHWISWIARLHNSAAFLRPVIESWIDVFDEIILIDNCSTDETPRICQQLVEQYPDKLRYISYPFSVAKPYSQEHGRTASDSLHSLVYYYNRCFSQAQYDIVCKIDDDNLLVPELFDANRMRTAVLTMQKNEYYCFWWYNVIKKQWRYHLLPIESRYSGLIGDIWFYYHTQERYFFKDKQYEKLNKKWLKMKWFWVVYIHLKYLKQWTNPIVWKTTYDTQIHQITSHHITSFEQQ